MTDMELNILVGIVGVAITIAIVVALWRRFDITNNIAKIQEDMANFYTPAILEKNKEKDEGETDADESETTPEGSEGEGSDGAAEDDESGSEGNNQ